MTTGRFADRVVVVVGGTSGVGRAAAEAFGRECARVAIFGRSPQAGQTVEREIKEAGGIALFIQCDATDLSSVNDAVAEATSVLGNPQILYNNAGKVIVKPFLETTADDWQELWSVNVVTMINSIKATLPAMLAQGNGTIVNMASISSLTASALESAYCTTKGACVQLTRSIAVEYREAGIRCNAVCPGFIQTEHGRNELAAFAAQGIPMTDIELKSMQGRIAFPGEIAEAVLFLASDASSFINGECLVVDNAAMAKT